MTSFHYTSAVPPDFLFYLCSRGTRAITLYVRMAAHRARRLVRPRHCSKCHRVEPFQILQSL
jgi:hypothetical protein